MSSTKFRTAFVMGAALLTGTQALAGEPVSPLCFTDNIQLATTNWSDMVTVPKFDSSLGLLVKVEFELTGGIAGSASIESLDAAASVVSTTYQADITLTRPDNSVLVVATPLTQFNDNLTSFDGTIDFGGTSGIAHTGIDTNASEVVFTQAPADLALFTGAGTIDLPVDAAGSSVASGSGNLITQFLTDAEASVKVCYFFVSDCNGNGIADVRDIEMGRSHDNNDNGVPDECEPNIRTFCDAAGTQNGGTADCPCNNNGGIGEGCENGTGMGGLLTASGNPSIANDTVSLTASQIPSGAPGFFWFAKTTPGISQTGVGVPFGMGLRCISQPILIRKLDNGGTVPLPGDPPLSVTQMIDAGETTYFQYWYRNNGGPCGQGNGSVNATNGIEIVWGL